MVLVCEPETAKFVRVWIICMLYIQRMVFQSPVAAVSSRNSGRLGIYAPSLLQAGGDAGATRLGKAGSSLDQLQDKLDGASVLDSLADDRLAGISCIIADIRHDARQVLSDCHHAAGLLPVIALADLHQSFPPDYPFGTHVADVTNSVELGEPLFWHRVAKARQSYEQPLTINDMGSPVYRVFQAIAAQSSDWILIKDLQHRFIVAGDNFAEAAGVSVKNIIGRNDLEIGSSPVFVKGDIESGIPGFWPQDKEVTDSGEPAVEETPKWQLYSDEARYRRTFRVPLKNPAGRVFALLVCSQDITEQVNNEQLLAERTSMLVQVTEEKTQAETNRRLAEDAVAAKTRFLAAASHDLRQPLHAMGLFLSSLENRVTGSREQHLVQQIKQSCTSLSALFNGCLDISRLDAGVIERRLEHFSVSVFLMKMNEEFQGQTREKSLEYLMDTDDATIESDKVLLTRIVRNLFTNAVQNTDEGQVQVSCRRFGERVNLSVIDTGCGISEEECERIFNEFHQVEAVDSRQGRGMGLGLSIVERLCKLLDINVKLDSQPGKGSRFTLSIPAGHPDKITPRKPAQPVSVPDHIVVLILENDEHIRYGMEVLLQSYGCETLCAADVKTAIDVLNASEPIPDVILADYHLSGNMTGTRAILELRDHLGRDIPALLVTGDTSTESEREAARYHLQLLYKPVDSDKLMAAINAEVLKVSG